MFKKDLENRLKHIFGFKKLTFNDPDYEALEQDTMFIQIQSPRCVAKHGRETAKVEGTIVVFTQIERMPYGFFDKKIKQAKKEYSENIFFYERDVNVFSSPARMVNLEERRCSFLFLYSGQYDPNNGQLTELEIEE